MPTFDIRVNVNVPGLGDRTFTTPGIVAVSIENAIALAKAGVIVTILAVIQVPDVPVVTP